jgi:hypothetical protein
MDWPAPVRVMLADGFAAHHARLEWIGDYVTLASIGCEWPMPDAARDILSLPKLHQDLGSGL